MKKTARKLFLRRETLLGLNAPASSRAVGGVISDASNCQHCRTIQPCLETGTCWEPTIDGCNTTIPSFDCLLTQQAC